MSEHAAAKAIEEAIANRGPLTFAEFMQLALYGDAGYYRSGSPVSASGDFFTSPSAHPLFGGLIAVQLMEMWLRLGSPPTFTVVEQAAGNGGLAADITETTSQLSPDFATALEYVATDIAPPEVQHYPVISIEETPVGIAGCILSNELLDAMPVHRFQLVEGRIKELYVSLDSGMLVETPGDPSCKEIVERVEPFAARLPDGYLGEVNLGLKKWAAEQKAILERGWLIAIDYGFERSTLYRPDRRAGSLRTYFQHTLGQDPLRHPGKQDITAHVDFTAVRETLEACGFNHTGTNTQARFLNSLGFQRAAESLYSMQIPAVDIRANEKGMHSLVDPAGLGGFVVTAYSRGSVDAGALSGFNESSDRPPPALTSLPVLQSGRHIDLTGPRTGDSYFEVQSFDDLFSDRP